MSVLHNLVSSWYGIPSDGIFSLFKDLLLSISLRKKTCFFQPIVNLLRNKDFTVREVLRKILP